VSDLSEADKGLSIKIVLVLFKKNPQTGVFLMRHKLQELAS
jgi:hypothetical protein